MDTSVNNADATYNRFFYTTVCHICKKFDNVVLKQCSGCRMIIYCSREHQKKHWLEHKDLCKAIRYVRETYMTTLSATQGTDVMMRLLREKVMYKLQRRLKTYEVQMFYYPRMCLVCKNLNGQIEHCPHCMAVWFCAKHKINHDSDTCDLLKLCFTSDLLLFREKSVNLTVAYIRHTSYEKEFSNMKEYINIYGDDGNIGPDTFSDLLKIEQSMYLTRPLTVLFGMRVLDYIPMYKNCKKSLVIHVISSSKYEILNLPEWEILLHFFTNLKCLTLVLIGPKLDQTNRQELCEVCQKNKKECLVEQPNVFYAQYTKFPTFRKPDLIIRFNNSFCDNHSEILDKIWMSSLEIIAKQNCPLFLCNPKENSTLHMLINNELGNRIEYQYYKNPFASLKPNRDYDDDSTCSVYYENNYLSVYKSLSS